MKITNKKLIVDEETGTRVLFLDISFHKGKKQAL